MGIVSFVGWAIGPRGLLRNRQTVNLRYNIFQLVASRADGDIRRLDSLTFWRMSPSALPGRGLLKLSLRWTTPPSRSGLVKTYF